MKSLEKEWIFFTFQSLIASSDPVDSAPLAFSQEEQDVAEEGVKKLVSPPSLPVSPAKLFNASVEAVVRKFRVVEGAVIDGKRFLHRPAAPCLL